MKLKMIFWTMYDAFFAAGDQDVASVTMDTNPAYMPTGSEETHMCIAGLHTRQLYIATSCIEDIQRHTKIWPN